MASVGEIRVGREGAEAARLLDCLRAKAEAFGVGIEPGNAGDLMVSDQGGSVDDLPAFLIEQLNGCGTEHDLAWPDYLSISQPQR
jgi:hypothetical protein